MAPLKIRVSLNVEAGVAASGQYLSSEAVDDYDSRLETLDLCLLPLWRRRKLMS